MFVAMIDVLFSHTQVVGVYSTKNLAEKSLLKFFRKEHSSDYNRMKALKLDDKKYNSEIIQFINIHSVGFLELSITEFKLNK